MIRLLVNLLQSRKCPEMALKGGKHGFLRQSRQQSLLGMLCCYTTQEVLTRTTVQANLKRSEMTSLPELYLQNGMSIQGI